MTCKSTSCKKKEGITWKETQKIRQQNKELNKFHTTNTETLNDNNVESHYIRVGDESDIPMESHVRIWKHHKKELVLPVLLAAIIPVINTFSPFFVFWFTGSHIPTVLVSFLQLTRNENGLIN